LALLVYQAFTQLRRQLHTLLQAKHLQQQLVQQLQQMQLLQQQRH